MAEVEAHNLRVEIGKKLPGAAGGIVSAPKPVDCLKQTRRASLSITIPGQIKGGKNNMIVTRSGKHFPKKDWEQWRNRTVAIIKSQLPNDWNPISEPCLMSLDYVAGDKRRRDMPAIVDSIFHCLEKAGVVADDALLWVQWSSRGYDKATPFALIEIFQNVRVSESSGEKEKI